ncbi:MAG: hypothetical protein EZS28_032493 [Streblomastix strix]|uniref:Uncharacterized protein n=1 Tax=Streblomastix strix TaxID=222440 RepID=A0A5J4UNC0_9EUKA|nr:MAG: hypothetical protein EZS28_032493 [Streblomastix strix]
MAEKGTALQNTVLACGIPFNVKWESSNSNGGSEANRELKVIYLDEEASKQSESSNIQRDMKDRRIDSQMNIFGLDESSAKRGSYKEFPSNSYGQVPASADMSHQHIDIGTIYNGIQPVQPLPVGGVEVEQVVNIKNYGCSNGLMQDKCSIPVSDSEMQQKLSRSIMNMNGQEMSLDQTQKVM